MRCFKQLALPALALVALLSGCDRTVDPVPDHLDLIYPIIEGKHRIYHVVDTVYESSAAVYDASTYYRKEEVSGTEIDLLDREVTKLWIYTSPDTINGGQTYQWTYSELWSMYLGEVYAERIEGNRRVLVLRVPPYEGSTWNGNLYNSNEAETYAYINTDTTVTVRGVTYDHCVMVLQVPFRVAGSIGTVYYREEYAYEIYAPGVGKIVGHRKFYEEQNGDPVPESRVYHEEIVSHNH